MDTMAAEDARRFDCVFGIFWAGDSLIECFQGCGGFSVASLVSIVCFDGLCTSLAIFDHACSVITHLVEGLVGTFSQSLRAERLQ